MTIFQQNNTTSVISTCGIFSPLILVILLLPLPSNFIISDVQSSRLVLILNVILFSVLFTNISVLFTHILIWVLSFTASCFSMTNDVIKMYSK